MKIPITFTVVLRIETAGRKGKTVTVIDGLPPHETYVRELARMLKSRCGAGGTYTIQGGCAKIEIQGNHCSTLRSLLAKEGIPVKG